MTLNGKRGSNLKYLPHAFTERGRYMLATILKSPRAIQATHAIIETCAQVRELRRELLALHTELNFFIGKLKHAVRRVRRADNAFQEKKEEHEGVMNKIKVGIVGCGFVGGALKTWLEENNSANVKVLVSDPPKGYNDDLSTIDVAFVQIHVPTEDDGTQDLTLMKQLIKGLPDVPVFVRTTVLPGTSEMLTRETGHHVCYMPEFLTERTHIEDFRRQTMVWPCNIPGDPEASAKCLALLSAVFPSKRFSVMSPLEAEITKYAHNVFGAYKVTYFNAVREYCQRMGADWAKVHTGVLLSGYINDMHTYVPGPDGKCGYGGKCFPKDVNAFAKLTEGQPLGRLLAPLHELNVHFRGFEEHI